MSTHVNPDLVTALNVPGAPARERQPAAPAARPSRLRFRGGFLVALLVSVAVTGISVLLARQGLGGGAAAGAADGPQAKELKKLLVSVEPVRREPIASILVASSTVEPERRVELVARLDGVVERVHVEEGDRVTEGQVLAEIDEREAALALRKEELRLERAELLLGRTEKLRAQKLVTDKEYDDARLERDVALAERDEAAIRLRHARVAAPFAGRITARSVERGQSVHKDQALFTLMDLEPLVADVHLPARDAGTVAVGDEVGVVPEMAVGVGSGRIRGRVALVAPVIDAETGTTRLRIHLLEPPASLKPGAFLRVEVARETRTDALVLTKKALAYDAGKPYVYRAQGHKVIRVEVVLGVEDDKRVEVLSGLSEGDRVVTVGKESLKDGAAIEIAG